MRINRYTSVFSFGVLFQSIIGIKANYRKKQLEFSRVKNFEVERKTAKQIMHLTYGWGVHFAPGAFSKVSFVAHRYSSLFTLIHVKTSHVFVSLSILGHIVYILPWYLHISFQYSNASGVTYGQRGLLVLVWVSICTAGWPMFKAIKCIHFFDVIHLFRLLDL